MKYRGTITVKIIEEIQPGLSAQEFLKRIEKSINEQKNELRNLIDEDEWRWAVG